MKLLLTAFDPFGGDAINPALEAVKLVADKIGRFDIVKLEVPTVFRKSIDTVAKAIEEEKPDVVLCIGQAGGRFEITPERVAINVDDARIKDNEGNQPIDIKIFEDGENAYFTTLPIKAMVEAIREANLPAAVSNTAGTFVCNHVFYGVRYLIEKKYKGIKSGFVHIPYIPEQVIGKANTPSMSLDNILKGIIIIIETIFNVETDIKKSGGTIC